MTDKKLDEDTLEYCNACGEPIAGSDQFCAGCGADLDHAHGVDETQSKEP